MKTNDSVKYHSIDLVKFIMAIFVIAMHTLSYDNPIYNLIVRIAVPYYFMCSGFLLMKKLMVTENKREVIKDYLKKIIKLYFIWSLIYLPITIYYFINTPHSNTLTAIIGLLKNYLFVGQQYYSWSLWYLLCTIYSIMLLYLFTYILKFNKLTIFIISVILFLLGYFYNEMIININNYSEGVVRILKNIQLFIGSDGGRILQGLIYINIGMFLYEKKYRVNIIPSIILLIFLIINILFPNDILKLPFNILVFYITILISLPNSKIYYYLRRSGVVMYFTHMIFFFAYSLIFGFENNHCIEGFTITLVCSIILAIIINIINRNNRYKILNTIFN